MDTQKGLRLLTAFGIATAAGFVLFFGSPAITFEDATFRGVGIEFRESEGNFFFKQGDTDITIKAGDTVVWLPDSGTHHLVVDSPPGAFKETEDFNKFNPQARTFNAATAQNNPIKYRCTKHPATMIGTITVK